MEIGNHFNEQRQFRYQYLYLYTMILLSHYKYWHQYPSSLETYLVELPNFGTKQSIILQTLNTSLNTILPSVHRNV